MNHQVMDYETLKNCFVAVFEHYQTDEKKVFVVHPLRNDFKEFVNFLLSNQSNGERHISYNGLAFDAQITEYILMEWQWWITLPPEEIAHEIYKKAQHVIRLSNAREWLDFYENSMSIKQLDVFKLNHWDNPAKRSSLKWIQFSMDWHNLQDMPIHHTAEIKTQEELDMVIEYCINDVQSTKKILYLSKDQITLRKDLTDEYGINLYSASEPRISKELFLHFLAKATGWKKNDIKRSRTKRKEIVLKDIILPYVKFNDPVLQDLHKNFLNVIVDPDNTKGSLKFSVPYHGVKIDYGLGGLHGARASGLYEAKDGMIIMTSDVKSYYPNLAIQNGWAPAHIPRKAFTELYKWFYDERVKIPKSDIRNYVYKIILNSTYGLSNDKFSFLYDPQFTMQITVNGQLSLTMLCEMLIQNIPGATPLMLNTDGLEMMIPEEYKEKYMEICNTWEEMTQLILEHDQYQKLILADVNNYIAVNEFQEISQEKYEKIKSKKPWALIREENGKYFHADTKCKGRFEFDGLALHKNKSQLVVSKAIYHFFIHDTPPESYLQENRNIFDYCIGKKIRGDWTFKKRWTEQGEYKEESLQKTIRYYVANNGAKVVKCHNSDGRETQLESGKWLTEIFNVYQERPWEEYNINEQYYLKAIYREIENVAGARVQQLSMF
jgi:hypothetical protein